MVSVALSVPGMAVEQTVWYGHAQATTDLFRPSALASSQAKLFNDFLVCIGLYKS